MRFDPSQHNASDVLEYCQNHPDEVTVVAMRELSGKSRQAVLEALFLDLGARIGELKSSGFEADLRKLRQLDPSMSLVDAIAKVDGTTELMASASPRRRAEWVLEQPHIVALLDGDRKIVAIKEVRAVTAMSLKEAKDAVELALSLQDEGYLTQEQCRQLELDEQAAIASILGRN